MHLNDKLSRGGRMLLRVTTLVIAIATICSADSLTLRSGRVVHGQYLGGDARQIRMAVGDRVDTFDVAEVSNLQFGSGERLSSEDSRPVAPPPRLRPEQEPPREERYSQPPRQNAYGAQLPTGTPITVRMIDGVDSEQTRLGQTFRASVDEPIEVNGQTVIPRGADCVVKLVEDRESGK